ncbi:MAG: AgmX/PglI C-terminal domain-containing protein [Gammaproteobacteria bacterium]|nr:AgmX/PglI C-terminal domain-containing protein [Gammaproteobacteria bacterium]
MSEQLSEKELQLERELTEAQQELEKVRADFHVAEEWHDSLRKRQPTAQILDRIRSQLAELSQLEQLEPQSPFSDERLIRPEQINQYYAGLIERIKVQVNRFRDSYNKAEERLNVAKTALGELRRRVDTLNAALEESRPAMRTHTVTRVGEDGVVREFTVIYRRESLMPWSEATRDERRFKKILIRTMAMILLFGIIIPYVPVPEIERAEVVDIPDRVAQLVQQQKPPPPPPPPPKLDDKKSAEDAAKAKKLIPRKQAPEPKTQVARAARAKAQRSGLFAGGGGQLSDLLDNPAEAKLGRQARVTSGGEKARQTTRSLITAQAGQGSGGLGGYALSRDVAGSGLAGRGTSRVTGAIIGSEFGDAQRPLADSIRGSRTDEEIQLVFDRNKSALYNIYQRALRQDPTLKGKIVLKITIDPAGNVLKAVVSSSDLGDKDLELKIAARVKLFNFGAKDVDTITISYPIDFLPA